MSEINIGKVKLVAAAEGRGFIESVCIRCASSENKFLFLLSISLMSTLLPC